MTLAGYGRPEDQQRAFDDGFDAHLTKRVDPAELLHLLVVEYFTRADADGTASLLADALGSTLALTDVTGNVETQFTYEPFGGTSTIGVASTSPFQYTGRENDGTGLYFYRARYYRPGLGRFLSEDPIGIWGGDANLYAYVRNNPISLSGPSGEWVQLVIGGAAGAVLGGLAATMNGQNVLVGAGAGAITGIAAATVGPAGAAIIAGLGNAITHAITIGDVNVTGVVVSAAGAVGGKLITGTLAGAGTPRPLSQVVTAEAFEPPATAVGYVLAVTVPVRVSQLPVPRPNPCWFPCAPPACGPGMVHSKSSK